MSPHRRLPISARHAFALAFDLAVRRDPTHSLAVPLLLRLPWILAFPLLPPLDGDVTLRTMLLSCGVLVGDFLTSLVVMSMLRFRAQSVYNTPPGRPPAPVGTCYRRGAARVPWLMVTEVVRTIVLSPSGLFLILRNSFLQVPSLFFLPLGLFLAFRLSMATEAVVLRPGTAVDAITRSFGITEGRFERWLEMIALSVAIVLSVWFVSTAGYLLLPAPGMNFWASAGWMILAALLPAIQYAWTFFYLRLEEIEAVPVVVPTTPIAAAVPATLADRAAGDPQVPAREPASHPPRLTLVESPTSSDDPQP